MAYADHFTTADDFIHHLDGLMTDLGDPFIQGRYLGFVALSAVTVFELSVKEVLVNFAEKKHVVLGNLARSKMEQINGRIKLPNLRKEFVKPFGDKYLDRFDRNLDRIELDSLRNGRGSVTASYSNIIQWRHAFVHRGVSPETTTFAEMKTAYGLAKEVVHCLNSSMVR
jgi:hypothetical protein